MPRKLHLKLFPDGTVLVVVGINIGVETINNKKKKPLTIKKFSRTSHLVLEDSANFQELNTLDS